jgi:hypothetical protein
VWLIAAELVTVSVSAMGCETASCLNSSPIPSGDRGATVVDVVKGVDVLVLVEVDVELEVDVEIGLDVEVVAGDVEVDVVGSDNVTSVRDVAVCPSVAPPPSLSPRVVTPV